ncbi:MAG: exodeoxyribonuclease III [Sterolibacterium sp.]|jgi:exodeoxyribonuclease-3
MLRIISINLNGIRSAASKGFYSWLAKQNADFVCMQELKAQPADLTDEMRLPADMHGWFHCAEKKGYSGVGIYSRHEPERVVEGLGIVEFDAEGRYLQADFGKLSIVSLYLPSGSSSEERQLAKFRFMAQFWPHLEALRARGQEVVLCGDWNIAHQPIDLKNWRSNQKNSGFLPEERQWLTRVFDELGWVDVFRRLRPDVPDQYTWWSNRGQARANNVGWRIDYHIATPGVAAAARTTAIYTSERFSDHAPLTIDYQWKI